MKTMNKTDIILGHKESPTIRFMESYDEVIEIVEYLRATGRSIVFTSGVWDLKHIGHEKYLIAAGDLGDVLIVGCDTDALTKKKGSNRPIVPMVERVEQLMNLRSVHIVVPIDTYEEADKLIVRMKPDFLVISTSTEKNKPKHVLDMEEKHAGNCGKIVALPPQATTSTTAKVRTLMLSGIDDFKEKIIKVVNDLHTEFKNEGGKS